MTSKQVSLSSYFDNKTSSTSRDMPIDLTNDGEELPQRLKKRRRTENAPWSHTKELPKSRKRVTTALPSKSLLEKTLEVSTSRAQRIRKTLDISTTPPSPQAVSVGSCDSENEVNDRFRKMTKSFENNGGRKGKGRPKVEDNIGPSGQTWTPLELQVRQLKEEYPGVLLLVQEGYRYRFFGDDAKIASRELGIVCYPKRNFLSASIPVERKLIHLKKLLSQGYKVGIVDQQETAALKKVGENKSGLFRRGLSALYTAATFVDDLDSTDVSNYASNAFPSLMCIVESSILQSGIRNRVSFGLLSVTPSTGDVVYDCFEDGPLRLELETRLAHLRPDEILASNKDISRETEGVFHHRAENGNRVRIERYEGSTLPFNIAMERISGFYEHNIPKGNREGSTWMASVLALPQLVVIALAHCIRHLENFGLTNIFRECQLFRTFSSRTTMLLNANTVDNLEIFRNTSDLTEHGSLFWLLDHTKTKFGSRLLRNWVARPLIDRDILEDRFAALEEILHGNQAILTKLSMTLRGLPDLAQGLSRIHYRQSTPKEVSTILVALKRAAQSLGPFESEDETGLKSKSLREIAFNLPRALPVVMEHLDAILLPKAKENDKIELWAIPTRYPSIREAQDGMLFVESELEDELKSIRKLLKRPSLQYRTVAGIEYLIEVPNSIAKDIPITWLRISKTKKDTRYHTPIIKRKLQEREQYKESVMRAANEAFISFQAEISANYAVLREAVNHLAIADCLFSLAQVASQAGYTRPEFIKDDFISFTNGRHPLVEAVRPDPFVPNSVYLGGDVPRAKIITGPNMGGKSSCVRMIALICIMAQVGCYVPADSVKMGLVDSVMTRMGAHDDLSKKRSTFMVELSETSEILRVATKRSLVILDELGRGTSTFDGMAIASSVFQFVIQQIGCKALFITHYPLIAEDAERSFPMQLENVHMKFIQVEELDRRRSVHFLYSLTPGVASGSFGVECARLAGLPEKVLESAVKQSVGLQEVINNRVRAARTRAATKSLKRILFSASGIKSSVLLDEMREHALALC